MSERVRFNPKRTCECPLFRKCYAGLIIHRQFCPRQQVEWLAQSGDSIIPGKRYRWVTGDDQWSRDRGLEEINVVAEVTRIEGGMVFARWHQDRPQSDQHDRETCIPNS